MCGSPNPPGGLPSVALWQFHTGGQVFRDRIRERDLSPLHHVCEEQRRKDLGDGTDLEDRVAIHSPVVARVNFAVGDDPATGRVNHAYNDSDALMLLVNTLDEQVANLRICWQSGTPG